MTNANSTADFPLVLRVSPTVTIMDMVRALATHGLTLRTDSLGRTWVEPIPDLIRARG